MRTVPLRSAADVLLGRMRSPENADGEHMTAYLRAANVTDGELRLDDVKSMNFSPTEQRRYALEPHDVLVTEGSGSRATVGACAAWPGSSEPIMLQNTLLRLRARPHTDPRFLYWWSRHAYGSGLYAEAAQGLAIWHLGAERVRGLPFVNIPLAEQRRIADFLDGQVALLDRLIDQRNVQAALLREDFQARLQAAISGAEWQEREALQSAWLTSLPQHWRFTRLSYFARLGSGHTPSRNHPEWWVNCTIPWITTGDVRAFRDDMHEIITETQEMISLIGIENSSAIIHPTGTVALSRTASAGFSMVLGRDMATSQDYATWTCGPRLDPHWLLWCLRAMRKDLLGRLAMGSTFKTIYMPDLQALQIPVPPLMEQQTAVGTIRSSVAALRDRLRLVDRSTQLLQERKQALITAAVTGQFDVTTARSVA
jgi:type I restriction enzyme S subunit